jgi:hypothetical protein
VVATNNTCLIVQVYFFEKIYVPHWDHSEICPRLVSLQEIQGKSTRRHKRSASVVCDIVEIVVESAVSHGEVVRPRENGAAISGLGAGETQLTSRQVAMREAHKEDPGSSVVVFEADSASISSFIVSVRGREVKRRITASTPFVDEEDDGFETVGPVLGNSLIIRSALLPLPLQALSLLSEPRSPD